MAPSLVSSVVFKLLITCSMSASLLHGEGLRPHGSLDGGELGLKGVVDGCDGFHDGLELGLLVGIHLVDGCHELGYRLLIAERTVVDGVHHLGEVVDHGDLHLVVYLGSVLLTGAEERRCCQQHCSGQHD